MRKKQKKQESLQSFLEEHPEFKRKECSIVRKSKCAKRDYRTFNGANKMAVRLTLKYGRKHRAYKCDKCTEYHITTNFRMIMGKDVDPKHREIIL